MEEEENQQEENQPEEDSQPEENQPEEESQQGEDNQQGGFNRETHKATCSECGQECEVPFKPSEGRPVFCRDCYRKRRRY